MTEETKTINVNLWWTAYREKCVPRNATEEQLDQLKQAFFGGAASLFAGVTEGLSPGPDANPIDETFFSNIENELMNFALARVPEAMRRKQMCGGSS